MKIIPVLTCAAILCACNSATSSSKQKKDTAAAKINTAEHFYDTIKPDPRPVSFNRRFTSSSFSSSTLRKEDFLGIWTISNDDPACAFEITEKWFFYCDFDGNAERYYKVKEDSIFLDDETFREGRILKTTHDSLVILWDGNDQPEIKIRWKN